MRFLYIFCFYCFHNYLIQCHFIYFFFNNGFELFFVRFHKSIKWEKYYVDLYSLFLNFVESLLPTADKSRSNIFLNSSTIYAHLQLKSPIVVIPEIMVHLLLPENHPNHKKSNFFFIEY